MTPARYARRVQAVRTRIKALAARARALARRGREAEAERTIETAIRRDPNAVLRWDPDIDRLSSRGDSGAVLRRAGKATRAAFGAEYALVARAETLRMSPIGRYAEALADLEAAARLRPAKAWIHAFLGRARFYTSDRARGLLDLDRALSLDPQLGWAWAWRGEARRVSGDAAGALADFGRAARLAPHYHWMRLWRGGLLRELGRSAAALADLELYLGVSRDDLRALRERGRALLRLGRAGEAVADLRRAMRSELNPALLGAGSPPTESERAQLSAAAADYARFLARRPASGWAAALRGETLVRLGDFAEAARALEAAVRLEPRAAWPRTWLAEALLGLGRLEEARREVDRSLALDPGYPRGRALRATLSRLDCDYASAARDFGRAGAESWCLAWRGEALLRAGGLRPAARALERALALDPRYVDARVWRGECRRRLGDARGAREDYVRALAADPRHALARLGLALAGETGAGI